jgi:hypothetical protein
VIEAGRDYHGLWFSARPRRSGSARSV